MKQLLAAVVASAAALAPVVVSVATTGTAQADISSHNRHVSARKATTHCDKARHAAFGRVRLVNMSSRIQLYTVSGTIYQGRKAVRTRKQSASVDPVATQVYPVHMDSEGRVRVGFKLEKGQHVVMHVWFRGERLVDRVASYSECWAY